MIACGHLLSNDGTLVLGAAVVLEVPSAEAPRKALSPDNFASIEVHQWEFGGRPT